MGMNILRVLVIVSIFALVIFTIMWEPKRNYTPIEVKIYHSCKDPEILTLQSRSKSLYLTDHGCIKDGFGNTLVCDVSRFEVIK